MASVAFASCGPKSPKEYPAAEREDVFDVYFGDTVQDPYRWMENDSSEAVAGWVSAQNGLTRKYLDGIPFRDALKERLVRLHDYRKYSLPVKKGGRYFWFGNEGLQNQSVLFCSDSFPQGGKVLLDPNALSGDGTVALTSVTFSKDGRYIAYTVSRKGSDWSEIFVIDSCTGEHTGDHIMWCKFSDAQWYGDGFFYSAYDIPEAGNEYVAVNEGHKIYYHRLGTAQSEDELFYENKKYPKRFYTVRVADDGKTAFLLEDGMGNGNLLSVKDLSDWSSPFVPMTSDYDFLYTPVATAGGRIYIHTNYKADRYRIMVADMDRPYVDQWMELIPEKESVLSSASLFGGRLYLTYDKDVSNHVSVAGLDGSFLAEMDLPGAGAVQISGNADDREVFYTFTSFLVPGAVYRYDADSGVSDLCVAPEVDFDAGLYDTKQVYFSSDDGTPVPMYITYRKDMALDGKNPVYMTGYGGFNISLYPAFSTNVIPFLESGGIFVQVNLRGGGEFGESWHVQGTKLNKQNVFDDFISAAEYLIANGYTSKGLLGISGGSNGGLLIGACVNQAPELFGAAVPRVGVMDMLRYHHFTIGWNWAPDYGTSDDSEEMYRYLKSYSPLHNIRNDGTPYPPVLVLTADHDDRVVPAHSFKYAAQLQWSDTGDAPKLIRIDADAGHGAGKPLSKIMDEQADIFAFIMYNLGMRPKFE